MSVRMGCEALMGAAMVMGRCLVAKYAKSHDDSTMHDLRKMCRCVYKSAGGTKKMVLRNVSGAATDSTMRGKNSSEQNMVLSSNTGMTALPLSADFLQVS